MDLEKYVKQSVKRVEIIEFVERDHSDCPWSIANIDRRLRHYSIGYIECNRPLENVYAAIQTELSGPGKLLWYRALNQKLRIQHAVKVPRHFNHNVLADFDQDGLDRRNLRKERKELEQILLQMVRPRTVMISFVATRIQLSRLGCMVVWIIFQGAALYLHNLF